METPASTNPSMLERAKSFMRRVTSFIRSKMGRATRGPQVSDATVSGDGYYTPPRRSRLSRFRGRLLYIPQWLTSKLDQALQAAGVRASNLFILVGIVPIAMLGGAVWLFSLGHFWGGLVTAFTCAFMSYLCYLGFIANQRPTHQIVRYTAQA